MDEMRYVKKTEADYPQCLNEYERMPSGLYLKGHFPDPEKKTVAMIGARACSNYGKNQALYFAECLAREGVQIVSGLAYGIDTYSHQGAIKGGGTTFAVLGCGVDVCYPKESYLLYEEILKTGGGILSEYEPGTPPLAWHFPIRNRIISGLADLVLVVEARVKSGSLITADYALEQGKTVFAVPGRVNDSCSTGCNALIAQGAGIAWNPDAVLEELFGLGERTPKELPFERETEPVQRKQKDRGPTLLQERRLKRLSEDQRKVFLTLESTELSLSQICTLCSMESRKVTASLTFLCLEGMAVSLNPGYYCRSEQWQF